ncbi:MAG: hypothetical protein M3Y70_02105 [Pseudomonadota bacterium]|nr:hypothetical protein [Pseudomonadota bacterium]
MTKQTALLTSAALLVLLLATLALSWPALTGPFLFDDFPNLQHLALLGGHLDFHSLANYMAQYKSEPGRPLSMLSFVVNDATWPSDPWAFKYTNLQLHLLIGVVLFGFARSLARLHADEGRSNLTALLAMAAWLLHPMQLSTSMLVVQRMTQLSALFVFASLWGYVAIARGANTQFRSLGAIAVLGVGTVLAVLSKETGALTPLLAVVVNATLLRRHLAEIPAINRRLLHLGTMLPVMLLLVAIAWRWSSLTGYGNRDFSMAERLLTQFRVLCSYLYQIVLPSLGGGGIYHDDFIVSRGLIQPWTTLPAIILISALASVALFLRRQLPVLAFGVLWFLAGHLLESSVFPLEIYFEHRNYLPMFGPLFALALWGACARAPWGRLAIAAALLWIIFASWLTWLQAPIWGDTRKLTAVWAIEHPMSARAVQQRAEYLAQHRSIALAAETMLDAYMRGVRGSDFPVQVLNMACVNQDEELARTTRAFVQNSLESGKYDQALLATIRKLRLKAQRGTCPSILTSDEWLAMTTRLLANPQYAKRAARKYLHVERSYLFLQRRDLNGTMRELEAAWTADPSPDLAQLIAATLASAGLYDEASVWADRALEYQVGGFRGWLSNDDLKSRRLKGALEAGKSKQKH